MSMAAEMFSAKSASTIWALVRVIGFSKKVKNGLCGMKDDTARAVRKQGLPRTPPTRMIDKSSGQPPRYALIQREGGLSCGACAGASRSGEQTMRGIAGCKTHAERLCFNRHIPDPADCV